MSLEICPSMLPRNPDGTFRSIILTGSAGTGKTAISQELLGSDAVVARIPMATRTFETFGTYPFPKVSKDDDTGEESVSIEAPVCEKMIEPLFEKNIGEGYGVLVLDDVTTGDERLQSAILDICQFHSIGSERLGKNVLIVSTGNRSDDGCYAIEWSKALLSRCMVIEHFADLKKWLVHKDNLLCDPIVSAFLRDNDDHFAPELSDDNSDDYVDSLGVMATPRDWTALGKSIHEWGGYSKFNPNILYPTAFDFVKANVGEKSATVFMAFAEIFGKLPAPSEVLKAPKVWSALTCENSKKESIIYSYVSSIYGLLKRTILEDATKSNLAKDIEKAFIAVETLSNKNAEFVLYFFNTILDDNDVINHAKVSQAVQSNLFAQVQRYPELGELTKDRNALIREAS